MICSNFSHRPLNCKYFKTEKCILLMSKNELACHCTGSCVTWCNGDKKRIISVIWKQHREFWSCAFIRWKGRKGMLENVLYPLPCHRFPLISRFQITSWSEVCNSLGLSHTLWRELHCSLNWSNFINNPHSLGSPVYSSLPLMFSPMQISTHGVKKELPPINDASSL